MMRRRVVRRVVTSACLVLFGAHLSGCATVSKMLDREYYLIEPNLKSLAEAENACAADERKDSQGATPGAAPGGAPASKTKQLVACDQVVVRYAETIQAMLRVRMNMARISRLTSATLTTLTAAAAAALTATAGAPVTAVTALAGTSAVLPEFSRIFGADERAKAYDEGVHLIGDAVGRYMLAIVPTHKGRIPVVLTEDGARLYLEVVSSLKIVESLLVAQLPKVEDVERAQGRVLQIGLFQVKPKTVVVGTNEFGSIEVMSGGVVTSGVSSNAGVVTVDQVPAGGTRLIRVKGRSPGAATVTIGNDAGRTQDVTIVVSPASLKLEAKSPIEAREGETFEYVATVRNVGPYPATSIQLDIWVTKVSKVKADNDKWNCSSGEPQGEQSVLRCSWPKDLPTGEEATLTLSITAPKLTSGSTTISVKTTVGAKNPILPDRDVKPEEVKATPQEAKAVVNVISATP